MKFPPRLDDESSAASWWLKCDTNRFETIPIHDSSIHFPPSLEVACMGFGALRSELSVFESGLTDVVNTRAKFKGLAECSVRLVLCSLWVFTTTHNHVGEKKKNIGALWQNQMH